MENTKKKIFVGMSGGVDSSVSAALLKEQGHDVTGVFIKTWHPEFLECDWKSERRDAMRVCAALDVPFMTLDLEDEYKKDVADYMIEEYRRGNTPNPDVMCNKEIKFGAFLKFALDSGADLVATGHYARIVEKGGKRYVAEGADKGKDQSYFLWTLSQEHLKRVVFPVGELQKAEVRILADKFGLPVAAKKDSQGVCFLGRLDLKDFLSHYIEARPGDVLDIHGHVVGRHDGAVFLTLGQRHGFEIFHGGPNDPKMFIVAKDIAKNTITVSPEPSDPVSNPYIASVVALSDSNVQAKEGKFFARYRYRQLPVPGRIISEGIDLKFEFDEPQAGVAKGQSLVVYDGDVCLGGGVIT